MNVLFSLFLQCLECELVYFRKKIEDHNQSMYQAIMILKKDLRAITKYHQPSIA